MLEEVLWMLTLTDLTTWNTVVGIAIAAGLLLRLAQPDQPRSFGMRCHMALVALTASLVAAAPYLRYGEGDYLYPVKPPWPEVAFNTAVALLLWWIVVHESDRFATRNEGGDALKK